MNDTKGQTQSPELLIKGTARLDPETRLYDDPEVQRRLVRDVAVDEKEASLIIEGITCSACAWSSEQALKDLPGMLEAEVNYATHRARVRWHAGRLRLSEILQAVQDTGYRAHPYDPARRQDALKEQQTYLLRRVAIAGVLCIQVMMISIALYFGAAWGIDANLAQFFKWVLLLLCLPIVGFCAQPFFVAAIRDLRQSRVGMDLPISIAISAAFGGSVLAVVSGSGEVYFDSVAMFTCLLLLTRFLEQKATASAIQRTEALDRALPAFATRLSLVNGEQREERLPVHRLAENDLLLVKPGDHIPVDGRVTAGSSSVNESLLTGESAPVVKTMDDRVIGGSINIESPLQVRVTQVGSNTVLAQIVRILQRAQAEKPAIRQLADRIASKFVAGVLLLATVVAVFWWHIDSTRWFSITLSILVISCPCALSLATPAAIAAATGNMIKHGLLTTRGRALEALARATHVVFDKTGTLTEGEYSLLTTTVLGHHDVRDCLAIAAALERHSEHPIAKAIIAAAGGSTGAKAEHVINTPGNGIQGTVRRQTYYLGTPGFVSRVSDAVIDEKRVEDLQAAGETVVLLATGDTLCSIFTLADPIRAGARRLVTNLRTMGKAVSLMTGDHKHAAARVAEAVGIDRVWANLGPEDKLARVRELQQQGAIVAMIGDGVNDAPVLAGVEASIAMGEGTQLARASADMILLNQNLDMLGQGFHIARKTLKIVRQNIVWAIGYNLCALPAAALGLVAPWAAAIGMSCSSLFVVGNALRLASTPSR